jgi:hypothetical protein
MIKAPVQGRNLLRTFCVGMSAILLLAGCAEPKKPVAGRLRQPAGRFSFVAPVGWSHAKLAGLDYIIVSAEPDAGARPNIFVDFIEPVARLSNVVERVVAMNENGQPAYRVVGRSAFETDSGLEGVKIRARRRNRDALALAVFHYLIQDDDRVLAITCTCAESVSGRYVSVFDAALRSVQTGDF